MPYFDGVFWMKNKMALSETIVAVVMDQDFGHRLWELAQRVPVWVCNSATNSPVIQELWETSRLSPDHTAVTSFSRPNSIPEQTFIDNLETVDLHHPSWLVLEVYGISRTTQITVALEEYGAEEFQDTVNGFRAKRLDHGIS